MGRFFYGLSLFFLFASSIFAAEPSIDSLKSRYDYDKLLVRYSQLKDQNTESNLFKLCKISHALSVVADYKFGYGKEGQKFARQAVTYGTSYLAQKQIPKEKQLECYYLLSAMYGRLINDAASWMKYHKDKSNYLNLVFEADPNHIGANLIKANDYLHMPPNVGGNPQKGLEMLITLEKRHPRDEEIPLALARYYREHKDAIKAEEYLKKVLEINPQHLDAKKRLAEINLEKKGLVIEKIQIDPKTKTSHQRLLRKLAPFVGKPYTMTTKEEMEQALTAIKTINGCHFTTLPGGQDKLEVLVAPNEDNLIAKGFVAMASAHDNYEQATEFQAFPAYLYMDHNFYGTGNDLFFIFAGLYVNARYTLFGLIDNRYPDVILKWESLFLPVPILFYDKGQELAERDDEGRVSAELDITSPRHNVGLMVGKTFDVGFSAFLEAKLDLHDWAEEDNGDDDLVIPSHDTTYTFGLPVAFSTLDDNPSKLILREGFSVKFTPEFIYKKDYKPWGLRNNERLWFDHDAKPCRRISLTAKYYRNIFGNQNIGVEVGSYTGGNYYQTEKWRIGNTGFIQNELDLSGFYPDEFDFKKGSLISLLYGIKVLPERLNLYAKLDSLYHNERKDWFHGAALGAAVKLPWKIELDIEGGVGLNAEREDDGIGYSLDILIARIELF